jgi:hypothetical protein
MFWTLVVMTLGGAPLPTGLVFDSLDACYQAEERMASEQSSFHNAQVGRGAAALEATQARRQVMGRGICVPHSPTRKVDNLSKKVTSRDPERLHQFSAMQDSSGPPVEAFIAPVLQKGLPGLPPTFRFLVRNPTARTVNIQNPLQNLSLIFHKPDASRVELPDKVGTFRIATLNGKPLAAKQESYSIAPKSSLEILIDCEPMVGERIREALKDSSDRHVEVSAFLLLLRAPAPGVSSLRLYDKILLPFPVP